MRQERRQVMDSRRAATIALTRFASRSSGKAVRKFLVRLERIAVERRDVGVARFEIADRPGLHLGHLGRRRRLRRIGPALEKHEVGLDVLRVPRHLGALGNRTRLKSSGKERLPWRIIPRGLAHRSHRVRARSVRLLLVPR